MLQAPADVGRLPTLTVKYTLYQCALKHAHIYIASLHHHLINMPTFAPLDITVHGELNSSSQMQPC